MDIEVKDKRLVDWHLIYDLIAAKEYVKLLEIVEDVKDVEVLKNIIMVICESCGRMDEECE